MNFVDLKVSRTVKAKPGDVYDADSGPSRTVIPTHRGQRSDDCGQLLINA
jgi:hypothetical protein